MNIFERILIVTDNKTFIDADALRGVLQSFNLAVHLHRLLRYRQAEEFFASDFAAGYDCLILCIHGMGRTEEKIRMEIEVIDQQDGDYSARSARPMSR